MHPEYALLFRENQPASISSQPPHITNGQPSSHDQNEVEATEQPPTNAVSSMNVQMASTDQKTVKLSHNSQPCVIEVIADVESN